MNWYVKLKQRWGISSDWQALLIFIVFGVTGSTSVKVSAPLLEMLGVVSDKMAWYIFWPLRILIITPIYQVLLLFFGFVAFQFPFFWNMEKKMLKRFGIDLDKGKKEDQPS
ncbi:MAG: prolipoprotein diacylglyceryl transferase [Cytophagaceae bacterium]|jgi:hypothetical protein|nr:prolipoprotein diacylglyceryl transferase [Cytophagaceae bacterium]